VVPLLLWRDRVWRDHCANDPNWDRLQEAARAAKDDSPYRWLAMDDIYGEVGRSEVFRKAFSDAFDAIWRDGTKTVLSGYLSGLPMLG